MSLKHQITSFPNNGFTGEVRERGKHWHSSAICGAVDEVSWFLAVFENIVLWKSDGPFSSHSLSLTLTQTHIHALNTASWSVENAEKSELVMNTSSILMAWESTGKMSGSSEAKHGLSLQTALLRTERGGRRGRPHTWQGPVWAAVQRLFTVSDSNRDPLKDKRSCVSQPSQLASGWSAVLFNDPHRGQGRGTWGDTQEIPGSVSSPMWESWLIQWVNLQYGMKILAVKDWLQQFLAFACNFCR